jgi:hypothetical protein
MQNRHRIQDKHVARKQRENRDTPENHEGPFSEDAEQIEDKKPPRQAELKQRKRLRAPTELSSSLAGQEAGMSKKPSSISLVMLKYCKHSRNVFNTLCPYTVK